MRIGIIGPSKVKHFCESVDIDINEYLNKTIEIAEIAAHSKNDILIVPEKKSISETFGIEYKKAGGKKVIGVIPMDDSEFGIENLNQDVIDEIVNCVTWRNQPEMICEESDLFISLGFGAGTLGEICSTKWFGKVKVLIIEDFITQKLPKEIERDINVLYIKADEVKKHL